MFHVEAGLLATGSPDKTVEVITMIIITGVVVNVMLVVVIIRGEGMILGVEFSGGSSCPLLARTHTCH